MNEAVQAFEDKYKRDHRDPMVGEELSHFIRGWNAALERSEHPVGSALTDSTSQALSSVLKSAVEMGWIGHAETLEIKATLAATPSRAPASVQDGLTDAQILNFWSLAEHDPLKFGWLIEREALAVPNAAPAAVSRITPENPVECTTCGGLVVGVASPPSVGEPTAWKAMYDEAEEKLTAIRTAMNASAYWPAGMDLVTAIRGLIAGQPIKQGVEPLQADPLSELAKTPVRLEGSIVHDWRMSDKLGGEVCANCSAMKGTRRGNLPCGATDSAKPAGEQDYYERAAAAEQVNARAALVAILKRLEPRAGYADGLAADVRELASAALAAAPTPDSKDAPTKDAWPAYVAGIIETYLQSNPAADRRERGITGIIERRLYLAPKAAPAAVSERINAAAEALSRVMAFVNLTGPHGLDTQVERALSGLRAIQSLSLSSPPSVGEPIRHSTKENGDCPHWCKACAVEREARATDSAKRCPYCDDSGDVTGLDGEWRGRCSCPAATDSAKPAGATFGQKVIDTAMGKQVWFDRNDVLRVLQSALAAAPDSQAQSIAIDFKQATELLAMFGGEPTEIQLLAGNGHSGQGLYALYSADPEGTVFLGETDEDAVPGEGE